MKKEVKHIIFSNMRAGYNCDVDSNYCRLGVCDCSTIALQDETINLDIKTEGRIIAIATIGTWRGRRQGYKLLGHKINNILDIMEELNEFYSDGNNIYSNNVHHDGRNFVLYRELRIDRTDEKIEEFLNYVSNGGELTPQRLGAYTKSIAPQVNKVYGWRGGK